MWERNVVTSEVFALVAMFQGVSDKGLWLSLILRLPNGGIVLRDAETGVPRLSELDVLRAIALAVFAHLEKLLDVDVRNWPLGLVDRLSPTAKIIVQKDSLLLFLELAVELRVDNKDWGQESLVLGVNRLKNPASFEELSDLRSECDPFLFNLSKSNLLLVGNLIFRDRLFGNRSARNPSVPWVGEVRKVPVDLLTAQPWLLLSEGSRLHNALKQLRVQCVSANSESCESNLFHFLFNPDSNIRLKLL